jgi:hypothetical protein
MVFQLRYPWAYDIVVFFYWEVIQPLNHHTQTTPLLLDSGPAVAFIAGFIIVVPVLPGGPK